MGSLAGGLWYGARKWRLPSHLRFLVVTGVFAAGLAPLPLADSMPVFAVLVIVAGLGLAPSTAAAYSLIGDLAPAGAVTEAYSWQIVGYVAGSAVGAWLAGVLVEHVGVATALACAPLAAALGLLVALAGRRAITASARPSPRSAAPRYPVRIRRAVERDRGGHHGPDRAVLHQLHQRVDEHRHQQARHVGDPR